MNPSVPGLLILGKSHKADLRTDAMCTFRVREGLQLVGGAKTI
jgi:hypothetical protein